ncbi:DUF3300 domain-containing protein [Paracidovorax wautersii]|uniref:DUF3300 domain-containing protein n=1 Tax=Paracidovorax wautersii TaxID=1177982 RepID=UPI0031DB6B22
MQQPLASAAQGGDIQALTDRPVHLSVRRSVRRNAPRYALALLAAAVLSACQRPSPDAAAPQAAAPAAAASAPTATPVAYTPPSAQNLYQMVAPIALYPDRLVAQVLAASTYPDQITDAAGWLGRNPGLRGDALVRAVNDQSWDPSVKALTAFPNVLEQLAANLPWTTALGQAYYHDPSDVMNAIQVMRERATKAGTLRSSPKLRVVTAAAPAPQPAPATVTPAVPLYAGPAVVAPPPSVIAIEPAEPATVYVPHYDPQVVYGTPVPVYPGYRWAAPAPVLVAAQPDPSQTWLAFGAGVVVGAVAGWAAHSPSWGWNAWNVHWGAPRPPAWVEGAPPPPPPVPPAVVYQGATYVSHSRTVIENIRNVTVNNNQHYTTVNNNSYPGGVPGAPAGAAAPMAAFAAPQRAAPVQPQAGHAPAMVPPKALSLATALSPVQRPAQEHGMPATHMQLAAPFLTPGGVPAQPHRVPQEREMRAMEASARQAQGHAPNAAMAAPFMGERPGQAQQLPSHESRQEVHAQQHLQPQAAFAAPAMAAAPRADARDAAMAAPAGHDRARAGEREREDAMRQRWQDAPPAHAQRAEDAAMRAQQPHVPHAAMQAIPQAQPPRRAEMPQPPHRPQAQAPHAASPEVHREQPHREQQHQEPGPHHAHERS